MSKRMSKFLTNSMFSKSSHSTNRRRSRSGTREEWSDECVLPFELFAAKYKITKNRILSRGEKVIGEGKFGRVFQGYDKVNKENVAVKVVQYESREDIDVQEVINEAEILRTLHHDNIVQLYDVYHDKRRETIYIITELATGGDLFEYIVSRWDRNMQKYSPPPQNVVKQLLRTLAGTLDYCHDLGIIHRDIKPENIAINDKSHEDFTKLKLLDFGFGKKVDINEMGHLRTHCGTSGYIAPEILLQRDYSKQCDAWALGCVLCFVLTGEQPFPRHANIVSGGGKELYIPRIIGTQYEVLTEAHYKLKWDEKFKKLTLPQLEIVKGLLQIDPEERLGLDRLLEHPWLCS